MIVYQKIFICQYPFKNFFYFFKKIFKHRKYLPRLKKNSNKKHYKNQSQKNN